GQGVPMPAEVECVGLVLYQFAPGMVMAAMVAAARAELASSIFAAHHKSPVRKTRGYGLSWEFVDSAKTRDLEGRLREIAAIKLLPADHGILAKTRFPAGAMVVWSAQGFASFYEDAV